MNTKALQKCIDELKQKEPNIQYVLGVLETVVGMDDIVPNSAIPLGDLRRMSPSALIDSALIDEEIVPEIAKVGRLGRIA